MKKNKHTSKGYTRYGMVIRVRPERLEEYKRYHEAVWPGVLERISASNIRNYTIFHHDSVLFSTFEYWGDDYDADMKLMATDIETRRWWAIMEPMQDPLPTRQPGAWWAQMDEVFHTD
jgi:L-rhamnose mutarotase